MTNAAFDLNVLNDIQMSTFRLEREDVTPGMAFSYRGQRLARPKNVRMRRVEDPANDNSRFSIVRVDDRYRIIESDCVEAMLDMDEASVDLIVTSPPYPNHGMAYGDRMSLAEFEAFSRKWFDHAARILKPGGAMWVNVGFLRADDLRRIPLTYYLFPIGQAVGLDFVQEIIWNPPSRQATAKHRFSIKSERWMYWVKPGGQPTFNLDDVMDPPSKRDPRNNLFGMRPVDVWTFNKVNGNAKARTAHPCQFPQPMIERIVLACSNAGDVVLDPFGGSGTTALAALAHDRQAILIERSAEYCEIARERLA